MTRETLWIVGAGGVGRETLDACLALGREVAGFADDRVEGRMRGLPVLPLAGIPSSAVAVVAIADPQVRQRMAEALRNRGISLATVVHRDARIAPETTIGPGSVVLAGAYVSSSVTAGEQVQVHYNATIGHDAQLDDRVTIYPGANVSGAVILEAGVTVGSNAVVLQGRRVGQGAFVGAGAVVTRDVAAETVVVGAPARPLQR